MMENSNNTTTCLNRFFQAIAADPRISITHIGLFASLLRYWNLQECAGPVQAYSYQVMELAKISAANTYHKCIRDLHNFGYIRYEPSFKKNHKSKIYFLE